MKYLTGFLGNQSRGSKLDIGKMHRKKYGDFMSLLFA
jgi:hypothetical protein